MKNKVGVLICFLMIFTVVTSYGAELSDVTSATGSEPVLNAESLPKWIDISYADLEHKYVSEYQLVTVTISEHNMWWENQTHSIAVDYDQSVLDLVNVVYYDHNMRSTVQDIPKQIVDSEEDNFKVSYQFYLKPNVDVQKVPLTITKTTDGKPDESKTIAIDAFSETTPRTIEVGDVTLTHKMTDYQNDGETIKYSEHFEVVSNPNDDRFTLTLKQNNMRVNSEDAYTVDIQSTNASILAIDLNNYNISAEQGESFDLNITASISDLEAKDDRFEFFIFLEQDEKYVRLEPTFFVSQLQTANSNVRGERYTRIKLLIAIFFLILALIGFVSSTIFTPNNRRVKKRSKRQKNNQS